MKTATADLRTLRGQLINDMRAFDTRNAGQKQQRWSDFHLLNASQQLLEIELEARERRERLAQSDEYRAAFMAYLRNGWQAAPHQAGMTDEQRAVLVRGEETRDMGTSGQGAYPGATAGFLAPLDFEMQVESAMKWAAPMLEVATMIDTVTGTPMGYPMDNDISTIGEAMGEGVQSSTADAPLSQTTFRAYKYSSKMVKVSMELVQDSAFDFESFLANKFGYRIGRVLNPLLSTGTGTGQPQGIVTGATTSTQTVLGNDNLTTPDPTSQVGYLDLVSLEHQLDPFYRRGAAFMCHDNTLRYIKTLKDLYGHPIFQEKVPGSGDTVGSVLGYRVYVNEHMDQLGHSKTPVIFGRLDKLAVRRAGPLTILRLSEHFAEYGQVAFVGYARRDSKLLDAGSHPVISLSNS